MQTATSKIGRSENGRPSNISILPGDIVVTTPRIKLRTPNEVDYVILTDIAEELKRNAKDTSSFPDILMNKDLGQDARTRFRWQKMRPRNFFELCINTKDELVGDTAIDCGDKRNLDKPDTEIFMKDGTPKGTAEEAYMAMCTLGFALGYKEMLREIKPDNGASVKIAKNLGYTNIGPSIHYKGMDRFTITLKALAAKLPELSGKIAARYSESGINSAHADGWHAWSSAKWESTIKKAANNPTAFYRPRGVQIGPFHYQFTR